MILDMIGNRLKQLREEAGLTQLAFAEIAKTSKQHVSQLESGRNKEPAAEFLRKWAKRFRVRMEWLTAGELPKESTDGSDEGGWSDVLGYAQAAGLGEGIEADDYAETHKLKFRADSLRRKRLRPQTLGVIYGAGDSMLPRIRSGDVILFDTADTTPRDESLFLVMVHGIAGDGYSVKRCRHFGDDVYFDALNPEGDHQWRKPRKMTDERHPISIIGRVRWIGSWE